MEIRSIGTASASPPAVESAAPAVDSANTKRAAVPTEAAASAAAPAPGTTQLTQAVSHLNQAMKIRESGVEFTIDEDSHRTVIKVVDQKTKELIRQMPSAEALEIAKALDRMQGLLIDQKT